MEDNTNTTPETVDVTTAPAEETVTAPAVEEEATPETESGDAEIRTNTAGDADIDAETHSREVAQNMEANGLSEKEETE